MKKILLLLTLAFTITANAQDDKTVTLTVSGQGKTQEEAKQVALRSAIEQAFGAFISSKTEILNDHMVKDEIVSITNGNIQKFDVLSEVQIPDGGYATTLKAVVSVTKLTSFCESKGVAVEFKGALIAFNAKLDNLNAEAELKTILNLVDISNEILSKSIDYNLIVDEPKCKENECTIKFIVKEKLNNNISSFYKYFQNTLEKIKMSKEEQSKYIKNGKEFYPVVFCKLDNNVPKNTDYHFFRNFESMKVLNDFLEKSNKYLYNFIIKSEIGSMIGGNINGIKNGNFELYGFPAATNFEYNFEYFKLSNEYVINSWRRGGVKVPIGNKNGIIIIINNTKPNYEIGQITFEKKFSLNEIGKISKFEIIPISKD